jgi:hypothetical protein
VPTEDPGIVRQCHQLAAYAVHELIIVSAGEIGPAYAQVEQCITSEENPVPVKAYALPDYGPACE